MSGNSALDDLADRNAVAIGRALAGGEASPVALTEHLLDRIDRTDDPVFLAVTADRALAEARMAEMRLARGSPLSPLDGVPIAWKDLVDMKGEVTTAGSGTRRDAPPATADAPVVVRATAAGMVNLGKVNLTEFAFSGLGHNPHFGTPFSPFGKVTRRTPGGSSSGSAVAITCGLAPCAIGTDTGGSVRIPAAFNGLVGFRTSEGRIDKRGVAPLSPTLDTVGPLARSVEDCVLLDMILRGAVGPEVRPRPVSQLSLLVPETVVLDDLDDAVAANFEQGVAHLEKAGARIRREKLDLFTEMARMTAELGSIVAAEAYLVHRELVDGPDVDQGGPPGCRADHGREENVSSRHSGDPARPGGDEAATGPASRRSADRDADRAHDGTGIRAAGSR